MKAESKTDSREHVKSEIIEAVQELIMWGSSHTYISAISDLTGNYLERVMKDAESGGREDQKYMLDLLFDTHQIMKFVSKVEPLVNKLKALERGGA